jgi:hypothetical protein
MQEVGMLRADFWTYLAQVEGTTTQWSGELKGPWTKPGTYFFQYQEYDPYPRTYWSSPVYSFTLLAPLAIRTPYHWVSPDRFGGGYSASFYVRCWEVCRLTGTPTLRVAGATMKLPALNARLSVPQRSSQILLPVPGAARRALREAQRHRRGGVIRMTLTATTEAGKTYRRALRLALRGIG